MNDARLSCMLSFSLCSFKNVTGILAHLYTVCFTLHAINFIKNPMYLCSSSSKILEIAY